ncbi:MAG: type II/IV secretion system ATPase subunit [Candidatus Aenigmarchaeota archaeon]|nr:type II/IV secretion system ATPase subunit [Candidatus Aenigmarchaeota archaeon]
MVCEYDYDENTMKVRVKCLGCLYGSSIEDYSMCMATTIDKLLEVKKFSSVVLARDREYEYDYNQTRMLAEIAQIIEDVVRENNFSYTRFATPSFKQFYPEWAVRFNYIVFDLMLKDPIGAFVELKREIRRVAAKEERASGIAKSNLRDFRESVLENLEKRLAKTQLITKAKPSPFGYHIGDRSLYRQLFMASIRPNFMFTRYMTTPPEGGESVDRYKVGDVQIEIFKSQASAEYTYFALPPEFKLSEEKYLVLDAARRYMASHKPTTEEFVRSERIREIFFNTGKDILREVAGKMSIYLSGNDIEQLATILTRYTAGYGVLEILLADERIQDLYINSPIENQPILIFHQDFEECRTNLIPTKEDAEAWATRLRIQSARPLDEANPVLDVDIAVPGGKARFAVITKSLSPEGLGFAIRRHRYKPWTLPLFVKSRYMTPLAAGLLSFLIDGSASVLMGGGRGSGKSSLLAAMMLELLPKTRIVVIQDTLELPLEELEKLDYNIESLKSRSVITKVETEMPADEALRTSLRLGDSALIVGEIRSLEAKALWEAMRIGALSNVVAGTIHGESAYGIFDRVVNDLDVPLTSFKATDIVSVSKMLRSADGLHRFRRMTEITEVKKRWDTDPIKEGAFVNLMEYSSKDDVLKPTPTLINGESEVINRIASYVKEWSGNWEAVWDNINLRAQMKQTMVEYAEQLGKPDLLEAWWVTRANSQFHLISEVVRQETGAADAKRVYDSWLNWLKHASQEQT